MKFKFILKLEWSHTYFGYCIHVDDFHSKVTFVSNKPFAFCFVRNQRELSNSQKTINWNDWLEPTFVRDYSQQWILSTKLVHFVSFWLFYLLSSEEKCSIYRNIFMFNQFEDYLFDIVKTVQYLQFPNF